jgi:AraC-like DNA-binding protein
MKVNAATVRHVDLAAKGQADTNLPFGQVAAVLDYSEASAFTRAFQRWSGQTPKAWRAAQRHRDESLLA